MCVDQKSCHFAIENCIDKSSVIRLQNGNRWNSCRVMIILSLLRRPGCVRRISAPSDRFLPLCLFVCFIVYVRRARKNIAEMFLDRNSLRCILSFITRNITRTHTYDIHYLQVSYDFDYFLFNLLCFSVSLRSIALRTGTRFQARGIPLKLKARKISLSAESKKSALETEALIHTTTSTFHKIHSN